MRITFFIFWAFFAAAGIAAAADELPDLKDPSMIQLPAPERAGTVAFEKTLSARRSVREYAPGPLTLSEVSQLLWAAQGQTSGEGFRTAPSAGGLYPLEIYLVAGKVDGLAPGIYKYDPPKHGLKKITDGDQRAELAGASFGQACVKDGAALLIFAAVYERVTSKYGKRGVMYTDMEAGHASQNVYLQAAALNLGTVAVGAFKEKAVKEMIPMPEKETPVYLMPVGRLPE